MIRKASRDQRVTRAERLDSTDVDAVRTLATLASAADGVEPLSEAVLLRLRHADAGPTVHLVGRAPDGSLTGYAHLAVDEDGQRSAELVVHPTHRRHGLGRALVEALIDTADGGLLVWAHGDHPSAAALALDLGFERIRVLWQMRRSLRAPLPEPRVPAGVSLRAFRPGTDDEAWLDVNRRAFAEHPEQGRWTLADLRLRLAEPWFDPDGFLLAIEDSTERVLGFHWTKVHGRSEPSDPTGSPDAGIGEVYVLGVDPSAHGGGLGRALTLAGLKHLRDRGLDRVMLFADESNTGAVALYTRVGFANWVRHVQYQGVAVTPSARQSNPAR